MAATGTFGGQTFIATGGDGKSYSSRANIRMIRIPGGDQSIIQRNPTSVHTLTCDIEASFNTVEAFRALVGLFGVLSWGSVDGSALLLRVEPRRVFRNDLYVTTLTFRVFRGYGHNYGANYGS